MKKAAIFGLAPLLLTACGVTYAPQSAQELRQAGNESKGFYKEESLTINRSAGDITNTLRDRSKQCLNGKGVVREGFVRHNGVVTQSGTQHVDFSTVLNTHGKGAELIVRATVSGDHYVQVAKVPDGGSYVSIIDVTPIDKAHAKVDIYYHTRLPTLLAGMKGWVTGTDLKCPEIYKDYNM